MIFTFYSYKGGVGRSMAMASVAQLLARRGLRVLAIDFDLEAPGLERYFFDGERCRAVRAQPGLIDLIHAYREALSNEAAFADGRFKRWQDFRMTAINVAGSLGGSVDLMTAGRREPESAKRDYALAVRTFDWQDFFHNWKGDLFFDWLRRQLLSAQTGYDVVLVDSRTGVTEMGGVCAYQLADVAVLLCAPNYQNLDGTLDVVRDFRSDSVRALRRGRPLEILALPARLEQQHPGRAGFLALFKSELGVEGLPSALAAAGLDYERLALPYLPQFAVAEQLVGDTPVEPGPLVPSAEGFERLADALTLLAEPGTALGAQREQALQRLTGAGVEQPTALVADTTKSSAGYDVFIDYSRADLPLVDEVEGHLDSAGYRTFLDHERIQPGQAWQSAIEQALSYSSVLLVCFGQPTDTELRARTIAQARRMQSMAIIPVLLPGADERALSSFDLSRQQALDLRSWPAAECKALLTHALDGVLSRTRAAEQASPTAASQRDPYPGARAFCEDDAAYFFGRDAEVEQLLQALMSNTVVVLGGAAQTGKSSLVLAGLQPRLHRLAAEGRAMRVECVAASDRAALAPHIGRPPSGDVPLLLVVDHVDSFDRDGSEAARQQRLADLRGLVQGAGERRRLLLVGRDAWSGDDARALSDLLRGAARIQLAALAGAPLRAAIEEPARRAAHLLEPGLAERLIESAGRAHSAIAQIQLALATIWPERKRGWLTNKNLDSAGHLGGIVARHHAAALQQLSPDERAAARVFFSRLVAMSSRYELVLSPQPWAWVASVPAIEQVGAIALRDRLAGAGVIDLYHGRAIDPQQPDPSAPELQVALTRPDPRVYFSDDAEPLDMRFLLWREPLCGQVRRWAGENADALLRGTSLAEAQYWLADHADQMTRRERDFIEASTEARDHELLEQEAREEEARRQREARERERLVAAEALAAERGERLKIEEEAARLAGEAAARLRRGRRWLVGMLCGAVLAAAVAGLQTIQEMAARDEADRATALAQAEAQRAHAERLSADAAARQASQALAASKNALDSAEQQRRAYEAALRASTEAERRLASVQVTEAGSKLTQARASVASVQSACPVGRRLYLHIVQEADRGAARALVPVLEKQGFIVPGIELVRVGPRVSVVRYFRADEQPAANEAALLLQKLGVRDVQVRFIANADNTSMRPCHYEAWFSGEALPRPAMAK